MATYTVTTTSDVVAPADGLSLREALALADVDPTIGDTIDFDSSVQGQTIVLAGSQLTVNSDMTIDGGIGVTIDADEKSRVLLVQGDGTDAVLQHLTITGGHTTAEYDGGGGIFARQYTTLALDHTTVGGNSTAGRYANGGGIYGYYTTLTNSTVSGNSTAGSHARGGGIYGYRNVALANSTVSGNSTAGFFGRGGGIFGGLTVTLANSTVSGNSTTGDDSNGGGIYVESDVTLTNSTVSGNSTAGGGADGGGISGFADVLDSSFAQVTLANSIVAGNNTAGSIGPDIAPISIESNGLNIFGSEVAGSAQSDRENVAPNLLFGALDPLSGGGQLGDNGGPTQTIALRDAPDNPALGRADPETAPATDQRGEPRPEPSGTGPDIGAFELNQSNPSPPPVGTTFVVTTTSDVTADDGQLTLREALALADADNLTKDRIEFAADVQGQTITLAGSQLTANSDVTVDGGAGVTIDAAQHSRVLLVQGLGTDLSLHHLTITGGHTTAQGDGGGGVSAAPYATLTLDHTTVSGNSTAGDGAEGGGISGDNTTLTNSTVSGNSATGGGGIAGDATTLANCIFAGNTGSAAFPDLVGFITASNGHNIFGSDVDGSSPGDRENVAPSLLFVAIDPTTGGGLLADNGGPTQTIALRDAPDNPALAGADPADAPTDQRGEARPQPTGTAPDIGAFELNQIGVPLNEIVGTPRGEFLSGTAGADLIRGLGGDDRLWGRPGDDFLFGDAGKDVLAGKAGIDQMTGGEGADRFLFRRVHDAPPNGPAHDEILDFSRVQHDKMDLHPIDADRSAAGNQAFSFVGKDEFTHPGQLRYEATGDGDFLVSGNTDRDLDADIAFAVHANLASLKAGDFLL